MIRCEDLSKAYCGKTLFSHVTCTIGSREKVAFIGRNGSGKSTLFRLISQQEELDEGHIHIPKGYTIGVLAQHARFTEKTALQEACTVLRHNEQGEEEWRAEKMLFCLGFDEALIHAPVSHLSGGYTLRLQLAKLLLSEPDLLLLDEPTNYLDIKTIAWLQQFLKKWPKELIAISHDREFLDAISTHTMGLHRGRLIKMKGTTKEYFQYLLMDEELHQKRVEKTAKERAHLQSFIDRFGAKASKARQAQSKAKMLAKLPELEALSELHDLSFSFRELPMEAKTCLTVSDLNFHYPEAQDLFSSLSFSLAPGEKLCLAGRNGKGKSTLLKLICGELSPSRGTIVRHQACSIGYFGQTNIDRLHPDCTIEEEIAASNLQLSYQEVRAIAGVMMFSGDDAKKKISVLSGGEKSRVLLGKILASRINLLILDEPTNHLDMESIEALATALESFSGALVLVTHSEALLHRLADRLILFDDSGVFYYPNTYELFLREKGWESNAAEIEQSGSANREVKERKEPGSLSRQERAKRVQERAKALKPVMQRITHTENRISLLEETTPRLEEELIEAIQQNQPERIESLSRHLKESKEEIDSLFSLLEELDKEKQEIERSFEYIEQ